MHQKTPSINGAKCDAKLWDFISLLPKRLRTEDGRGKQLGLAETLHSPEKGQSGEWPNSAIQGKKTSRGWLSEYNNALWRKTPTPKSRFVTELDPCPLSGALETQTGHRLRSEKCQHTTSATLAFGSVQIQFSSQHDSCTPAGLGVSLAVLLPDASLPSSMRQKLLRIFLASRKVFLLKIGCIFSSTRFWAFRTRAHIPTRE